MQQQRAAFAHQDSHDGRSPTSTKEGHPLGKYFSVIRNWNFCQTLNISKNHCTICSRYKGGNSIKNRTPDKFILVFKCKKKIKYSFFKDIFDSCTCLFLSKIVVYWYSPHLKNIHVTIYIIEAKLHKTHYVMGMILLNQVPVCYINNLRI